MKKKLEEKAQLEKPSRDELDRWIGNHYVAITDLIAIMLDYLTEGKGASRMEDLIVQLKLMQKLYSKDFLKSKNNEVSEKK